MTAQMLDAWPELRIEILARIALRPLTDDVVSEVTLDIARFGVENDTDARYPDLVRCHFPDLVTGA